MSSELMVLEPDNPAAGRLQSQTRSCRCGIEGNRYSSYPITRGRTMGRASARGLDALRVALKYEPLNHSSIWGSLACRHRIERPRE